MTTSGISASARLGRGQLVHDLEVERHVDGQPDHRAERPGGRGRAITHHRISQHGERQKRFARELEPADESKAERQGGRHEDQNGRRHPRKARAAGRERNEESGRGRDHQRRAHEVELMRPLVARQPLHCMVGQQRRDQPKRYVEPEDHRPVQVLRDDASERGPGNAGHDPGCAHIGLVAAALTRG